MSQQPLMSHHQTQLCHISQDHVPPITNSAKRGTTAVGACRHQHSLEPKDVSTVPIRVVVGPPTTAPTDTTDKHRLKQLVPCTCTKLCTASSCTSSTTDDNSQSTLASLSQPRQPLIGIERVPTPPIHKGTDPQTSIKSLWCVVRDRGDLRRAWERHRA